MGEGATLFCYTPSATGPPHPLLSFLLFIPPHCPLPTVHCALCMAHCPPCLLPTALCPLPTSPPPTAHRPSVYFPLPKVYHPLPTAHCPLSTAHCPLQTATTHCLLPTAHCPLSTALFLLPKAHGPMGEGEGSPLPHTLTMTTLTPSLTPPHPTHMNASQRVGKKPSSLPPPTPHT